MERWSPMAELNDILAAGTVGDIKQNNQDVIDVISLEVALITRHMDGIEIPEVLSVNAQNGSIFFDPTHGQIRYKSPSGILLKFRMQLV
jgi:hypothetical protein